ncbi:hypothetical protein AAVH_42658, partial [Aphelenchoides avenae]
ASLESKVTGRVQLAISNLEAEHVVEAGVVLAEFSKTLVGASSRCTMHYFEFDFPDQGNGAHLQVRFTRGSHGYWTLQMRRGNKDDRVFFDADFEDV